MATKDEILASALTLPEKERAEVAGKLLQSLDEEAWEPEVAVEEAWGLEIERRAKELDEGRVQGVPLEDFLRKLDERRARRVGTNRSDPDPPRRRG